MSLKLTQKNLFKGIREFEIVDDHVNISITSRFKQESLSVTLAVLNPEPVITRSSLEFLSRVNGEPLITLALSKPNVAEFNAFVNTLKQMALAEYNAISGINVVPRSDSHILHDEPPEFGEHSLAEISSRKTVDVNSVEHSIDMLKTYVKDEDVQPLIAALEALKNAPQKHARLVDVASAFEHLETSQGAVLTYAPYIILMLSDDPFGS